MKKEIIGKLSTIKNPYNDEMIDFSKIINHIEIINEEKVEIDYKNIGNDHAKNKMVNREVVKMLKMNFGFKFVKITNPNATLNMVKSNLSDATKVIAILSGKGGVGKSQVTVNLARSLTKSGYKVGIIDADIYGYSIPKILDLYETPRVENEMIIPLVTKEDIEVISSQYFIEDNENKAIVWRAPMLNKIMNNFFNLVKWNKELDFLLIDMPPGTGDVMLNLTQYVSNINSIIVTTPNPDASHVALRSGILAKELNFNILGVVENMSFYLHKDEVIKVFGSGGAEEVAKQLETDVIGQIQITTDIDLLEKDYKILANKMIEKEKNA